MVVRCMSVSIESESGIKKPIRLGFLAYYQPTGLDRKEVFAFLDDGGREFHPWTMKNLCGQSKESSIFDKFHAKSRGSDTRRRPQLFCGLKVLSARTLPSRTPPVEEVGVGVVQGILNQKILCIAMNMMNRLDLILGRAS